VIPAFVVALVRWQRRQAGRLEQAIIVSVPLYLLGLACLYRLNVFVGRYTLTAAAVGAPLFAPVLRHWRYATTVAAVALITLTSSVLFDHAKPSGLDDGQSIWTMSRAQAQSVQRPAMLPVLQLSIGASLRPAISGMCSAERTGTTRSTARRSSGRLVALRRTDTLTEADQDRLSWVLVRRRDINTAAPGWRGDNFPEIALTLLHRAGVGRCRRST
jgi:hypothetical protein